MAHKRTEKINPQALINNALDYLCRDRQQWASFRERKTFMPEQVEAISILEYARLNVGSR